MTTLTACRKEAKKHAESIIIHNDGHVDGRGIDRGFTLMIPGDQLFGTTYEQYRRDLRCNDASSLQQFDP